MRSLEALFPDGPEEGPWLSVVAWARESKVLIIGKSRSSGPVHWGLWAYDLERRAVTKVRDHAVPASRWTSRDPVLRDVLAIRYRLSDEGPRTLALLNLASNEETEIATGEAPYPFAAQWDPTGEKLLFFDKRTEPDGRPRYVLTIHSTAAGKAVAERTITDVKAVVYGYLMAWMPDGKSVMTASPTGGYLRILGPDLQDLGRIDLPAKIKDPAQLAVVGAQVLLVDSRTESLWRYSLEKKRWARVY
jgi:hypothetical protein